MPEAGSDVDVEAVQPLPLGPIYASDDAADVTPMQPIMPEAGSDLDVEAVQPLPLGPIYASDDTVDVIPMQPIMPEAGVRSGRRGRSASAARPGLCFRRRSRRDADATHHA